MFVWGPVRREYVCLTIGSQCADMWININDKMVALAFLNEAY